MSELKHLTPPEAHQLLQENPRAVLIDIRSTMEHLFVGHPKGAVHISWVDEPDWTVNPQFVTRVRELMLGGAVDSGNGAAPVVLICRSGRRSIGAGNLLIESSYDEIFHIRDGFEGELDGDHHRNAVGGC